ncbi:MAG: hypothetical protein HY319_29350 [Armatimonadetes bacterium]|nr:hypothetical protein [Armatimonadota bacterium]
MSSAVEGLLAELRSGGQVDSKGVFSLDLPRTLDKLSHFRLPSPYHYARNLVASAVAAGATYVRFYSDADDTVLEHDGKPYPATQLRDLFGCLFEPESNLAVQATRELAIGLHEVRRARFHWARLLTWDGQAGADLQMTERFLESKPRNRAPWPDRRMTCRLSIREKPGLRTLRKMAVKTVEGKTPEARILDDACRLAPIPVFLNGQLLPLALQRPMLSGAGVVHLFPQEPGPRVPELLREMPADLRRETPDFFALIARTSVLPELTVVIHGIAFPGEGVDLGRPGVCAVVYSNTLVKDLSETQVVRNQEFEAVVARLRQAVAERWPSVG